MVSSEKKAKLEEFLHALPQEKRAELCLTLIEQEKKGDLPPELTELFTIASTLGLQEMNDVADTVEGGTAIKGEDDDEGGLLVVRKMPSSFDEEDEEGAQESALLVTRKPQEHTDACEEHDTSTFVIATPKVPEKHTLTLLPLETALDRPRNAMHAFFAPLKDMVTDPPPYTDRISGLVCSNSIPLIWRLLNEEDEAAILQHAWHTIEKMTLETPASALEAAICALHKAGESLMHRIFVRCTDEALYRENVLFRLGGEVVFADMQELVGILGHTTVLSQFAERTFSQSALSSCEDPVPHVVHQLQLLKQEEPAALRYGQFYCLSRIPLAADALLISQALQRDGQFDDDDAELLGLYVLHDLTAQADWLEQVGTASPMERPAIRIATHYVRNTKRAADITDDSWWREWGEKFGALAKKADHVSDVFCVASEETVLQCIKREADGCEHPDLKWVSDGPTLDAQTRLVRLALDYLCAVSDLYPVSQDLCDKVIQYADDLIELMAVIGGERYRAALKLAHLLHFILERLCGEEVAARFGKKRLSLENEATKSGQTVASAETSNKTVRFI